MPAPLSAGFSDYLSDIISDVARAAFRAQSITPIHGGDIHQSYQISDNHGLNFFLKTNHRHQMQVFSAEKIALDTLGNTLCIKTPKALFDGCYKHTAFLLMEFLGFTETGDDYLLGQQLAKLHRHTEPQFGFESDNFIGSTPQQNPRHQHWIDFWIDARIGPQLERAYNNNDNNGLYSMGCALIDIIPELLKDHKPSASLVHGDLWAGNKRFLGDGSPVIFDPACYYGDREVDIAMTELFGGFSRDFYRGYHSEWPLAKGYQQRKTLYNLYHLLNHLNLFGDAYLSSCFGTIKALIKAGE
ncbi:MAG: fructosamine kinase family protein [Pseudomonadota bacterium]